MDSNKPVFQTAWTLLKNTFPNHKIMTFGESLDKILGGGIYLGHVTELAGPASIGKSQICMQLAVNVQVPTLFAGVQGKAIYIDTEGSYAPKRLEQIAEAAVDHIRTLAKSQDCTIGHRLAAKKFTVESILNGIFIKRCLDLDSMTKVIEELSSSLRYYPEVKLVIVDSFAFHFRDDQTEDWSRILYRSIVALVQIARELDIAVVAVNQMTVQSTEDGNGWDEACLSELLTRNCGDQLLLGWKLGKSSIGMGEELPIDRCAVLYKSSHRERAMALFRVCESGVRDL